MKYLHYQKKGKKDMTREREIEILKMDGCRNTAEAERYLKKGCMIFEGQNFENFFDEYMEEWNIEPEDIPAYRKMIEEKIPVRDWGIVEDNGKTYYIMYGL